MISNINIIKYNIDLNNSKYVKIIKMKTLNNQERGKCYETCANFETGRIKPFLYVIAYFFIACEAYNLVTTLRMLEF